jgi:carbon-monoxide dehydrogenase medium subunit
MKLPKFEYARPNSLSEAIALLAAGQGTARPLAGGQTLIPLLAFRMAAPGLLVDLRDVPDLSDIRIDGAGIHLGARVRWCDILADAGLAVAHPLLVAAISHVAHYQIRKRGTVGGSLAHADPAAEMPGLALACDAILHIAGPNGARQMPAAKFFRGALTTDLAADELLTGVQLPPWPADRRWAFQEFARRQGDFAIIGIFVFFDIDAAGRITAPHVAAIGAGATPLRLPTVEAALDGATLDDAVITQAAQAGSAAIDPPDDLHGSAAYRRALAATLIERALRQSIAPKVLAA